MLACCDSSPLRQTITAHDEIESVLILGFEDLTQVLKSESHDHFYLPLSNNCASTGFELFGLALEGAKHVRQVSTPVELITL